jgi:hypothetical protein
MVKLKMNSLGVKEEIYEKELKNINFDRLKHDEIILILTSKCLFYYDDKLEKER